MSNDKNGTKYGNMGIKWTVLIRLIDIRTQKSVLTYNTWQKIWKYYECHFSYVFWWKKRVFQRRVFLIIEEAKKMFFLLYICIGMGAATVPMQIPTFGIFEHPYYRCIKNICLYVIWRQFNLLLLTTLLQIPSIRLRYHHNHNLLKLAVHKFLTVFL